MSKLSAKIKEELLWILPPSSITVAALILGKAVVIADPLPFINRFPQKPLIYHVAWKTVIYRRG